jgi:molybdopterin converting factor small subunit
LEVRIRLGSGLARLARAPLLTIEVADGATVADLRHQLATRHPELAPALRSALAVVQGAHVEPGRKLDPGAEVALLAPISGG